MFDVKKLICACMYGIFILAGNALAASNVLLLTTTNSPDEITNPMNYLQAFNNLQTELTNTGATVTRNNSLLLSPPAGAILSAIGTNTYDTVVIASTYANIDPSAWTELQSAIASRAANSFIFFVDTVNAVNTTPLVSLVNAMTGWTATASAAFPVGVNTFPLNTLSPYQSDFTGLSPITGGWNHYFSGTPAANSVYLSIGASPIGSGNVDAYTVLVPASESFGGNGACTIVTGDMSGLDSVQIPAMYAGNQGKFGPAFMNAVKHACGLPSIAAQFAPSTLAATGTHATLTLTVSNPSTGVGGISGVSIANTLPANLTVGTGVLNNTCGGTTTATAGGNNITLSSGTLPAATAGAGSLTSATCVITVDVVWSGATCSNTTATNTITPPTNFSTASGQVLAPAQASLLCNSSGGSGSGSSTTATPVPALHPTALLVLIAGLLGLAGLARRRRALSLK